jgi:putative endonuclease
MCLLREYVELQFYVYITTNHNKTVLYVGVTNDLRRRLYEHKENKGNGKSFTGKYYCYNLVYYEHFSHIDHAIEREKEIKKWRREKKGHFTSFEMTSV